MVVHDFQLERKRHSKLGADTARGDTLRRPGLIQRILCLDASSIDQDEADPARRYRPAKGSRTESEMKKRIKGENYQSAPNSFAGGTTGGAGAGGAC